MAKSNNGGTTKGTIGEAKAERAPARRRTISKSTGGPIASAPDLAADQIATSTRAASVAKSPTRTGRTARVKFTDAAIGESAHAGLAPSPEEVQRLAYELYVRRGGADGNHLDDWYEAERQLRKRTH